MLSKKEAKDIIKNAIDKINALIAEGNWQDAHRACLEILRFDPDNIKIIRLKNVIEKNVKKINIKALKEDLESLKPLWEQKKYEELLTHLKELEPYINDYPPLRKIILKAQTAYQHEVEGQQKDYIEQEISSIEKLMNEGKHKEALMAAEKLRKLQMDEKKIVELIKKIRKSWIDYNLSASETLLKSDKYEDILLHLHKLKEIDPDSTKIKQLIETNKKKAAQQYLAQKRDFIFIGVEKTRTLLQLKKYEKAAQAAKEILDIDPKNVYAKRFYIKAIKKDSKLINKEVIQQMKKNQKLLKEEYKKDKTKFLKF